MNLKVICTLCLSLFFTLASFAQLHVDEDQDVGIGVEDTGDSKMVIANNSNNYSLQLTNNFVHNAAKYGVYNFVGEEGLGIKFGFFNRVKQNASSTLDLFGIRNETTNYGTGKNYGYYSILNEDGDSEKQGIRNIVYQNNATSKPLYGMYQFLSNKGGGNSYGNVVRIEADGIGLKSGFYAAVYQNSSGIGTVAGVEALVYPASAQASYGLKAYISPLSSSSGTRFGIHSVIPGGGSGGTNYGVYSLINNGGAGGANYGVCSLILGTGGSTRYGIYADITGGSGYSGFFKGGPISVDGMLFTSDEKFKEDIKNIDDCSDIIKKIKPRRYKFKKNKLHEDSEKERFGFIAQELETVLPGLVSTVQPPNSDLAYTQEEGPDGELISTPVTSNTPPETYKAINYIGLIPIMTQALKEQQTQIEKQQKQIDQLIKKVEELSK